MGGWDPQSSRCSGVRYSRLLGYREAPQLKKGAGKVLVHDPQAPLGPEEVSGPGFVSHNALIKWF